jgi:hypothetical protein
MRHPPLAIDRHDREVVVGIAHSVAGGAIADFEIDDVRACFTDEAMGIARYSADVRVYALI